MDRMQLLSLVQELNLSGMANTLEARLNEALENQLSHEELLALIFQDEKEVRGARSLCRRLQQAKFEEEKTFEVLDLKRYSSKVQQVMKHLMTGHYLQTNQHVIILGPTGTGKTHFAQALGHQACRQGLKVRFIRANLLFREFQASRADDSWKTVFNRYSKADLLIIDDFGLKALTASQAEDIYELIADRHVSKNFIFTSNRKVEGWVELFPDPVMANAALDRLSNQAFHIILEGESYRKNFRPTIES